jgi:hypothetical protein
MPHKIITIGGWDDETSRSIRLQNFISDGKSFIPIFSDWLAFKRQVEGSGLEGDGLEIDRDLLLSILRGDELLILNPGDPDSVQMTKADLADGLDRDFGETAR